MKLALLAAALAITVLPFAAQAQKPPAAQAQAAKPTKASAQKVVQIISGDKAKSKAYCDMAALNEQIEAADKKKDTKTVDALSQKADDLGKTLGPEYAALMAGMEKLSNKEADDIGAVLEPLDKACGK